MIFYYGGLWCLRSVSVRSGNFDLVRLVTPGDKRHLRLLFGTERDQDLVQIFERNRPFVAQILEIAARIRSDIEP